jgi:hypothetical protein
VGKTGLLKELFRYFVSDEHFSLRQLLGVAVRF